MTDPIGYWHGKPISEFTQAELLDLVKFLIDENTRLKGNIIRLIPASWELHHGR